MSSFLQEKIAMKNAVRASLLARSASNLTEYRVNSITPRVLKMLSKSYNLYSELTAKCRHPNCNISYIGCDPDNLHLCMDNHSNILIDFSNTKIGLNRDLYVHSNISSRSCHDIASFNDAYLTHDLINIGFDDINNQLEFHDKDHGFLNMNANKIKVKNDEGFYSTVSPNSTITSYDRDNNIMNTFNILNATTSTFSEGCNLYLSYQNITKLLLDNNYSDYTGLSLQLTNTSNESIYALQGLTNVSDMPQKHYDNLKQQISSIFYNYLLTSSNLIYDHIAYVSNTLSTSSKKYQNITNDASNQHVESITMTYNDIMDTMNINFMDMSNMQDKITTYLSQLVTDGSNDIFSYFNIAYTCNLLEYLVSTCNVLCKITSDTSDILLDDIRKVELNVGGRMALTSNNVISALNNSSNNIYAWIQDNINYDRYTDSIKFTSNTVISQSTKTSNALSTQISRLMLDDIDMSSTTAYITNHVYSGNNLSTSNVTTIGHIMPSNCNLLNLGSADMSWKDIHVSKSSIYLGDTNLSLDESNDIAVKSNDQIVNIYTSKLRLFDSVSGYLTAFQSIGDGYINISYTTITGEQVRVSDLDKTLDDFEESLTTNLFYKPSRAAAIIDASNIYASNYVSNSTTLLLNEINRLSADQFKQYNKFHHDVDVRGTITTSNLYVSGSFTSIKTYIHNTENIEIGSTLKVVQNKNYSVSEFSNNQMTRALIINQTGRVGIGNTSIDPSETVDLIGSVRFLYNINHVTSNQLQFLKGISANVQIQLTLMMNNSSNYVFYTSNQAYNRLTSRLYEFHDNSNYMTTIANLNIDRLWSTSNVLVKDVTAVIGPIGAPIHDYISNISNLLSYDIRNTSNMINKHVDHHANISNYISVSSNNVNTYLQSTSNDINQSINLFNSTGWQQTATGNNLFVTSNVGIGTSQLAERLDVLGNTQFTGKLNNTTSNELIKMTNIRSGIQSQINDLGLNGSNYIRNMSNMFSSHSVNSSNTLMQSVSLLNTNMSNFVRNASNMTHTNIVTSSNILLRRIQNLPSVENKWNNVSSTANIYITSNVVIGSNISIAGNSLTIFNSNLNVVNVNTKKQNKGSVTSQGSLVWTPVIWYQFDNTTPVNFGIINDKNPIINNIKYNLTILGSTITSVTGFSTAGYLYDKAYFWNNTNKNTGNANPTSLQYLVNYNQATGTDDSATRAINIQNLLKLFNTNNGFTINFLMKTHSADIDTPTTIVPSEIFYIGSSLENIIRIYIQNTTLQNSSTKTLFLNVRYGTAPSGFNNSASDPIISLQVSNIKLSTQYIITLVCNITETNTINLYVYLNGILITSSGNLSYDGTYLSTVTSTILQIGKYRSGSTNFDAAPITLQDFRVYARPMTSSDVSILKTSILNYTEPLIWYQFAEDPTTTSIISDSSALNVLTSNYTFNLTVMNNKLKFNQTNIFSYDLNSSTPVAWYQFNNDELTTDSSGNSRTLTATNTISAETTDYKRGSACALFQNGNSYFNIANTSGTFSPDNFTICCWCKLLPGSTNTTYQTIASCRGQSTNWYGWSLHLYGGTSSANLVFAVENGGTNQNAGNTSSLSSPFVTSTAAWKHLAVTMNKSSSTAIIYVDGVLTTTITSLTYSNAVHITNFRIGADTASTTRNLLANSLIDDFRFYNRVLTLAEIMSIIGFIVEKRKGKVNYPYDNALLWDGNKSFSSDNVYLMYSATSTTTTETRIQRLLQIFHDNKGFSIHFLLKINSTNLNRSEIFFIGTLTSFYCIRVFLNSSNNLVCDVGLERVPNGATYATVISSKLDLDTYLNVDIICNISQSNIMNLYVYVDGILKGSTFGNYKNTFIITNTLNLVYYIGRYDQTPIEDASKTYIQDFRIFPSALSTNEISFLKYLGYNAATASINNLINSSLTSIVTSSTAILPSSVYPDVPFTTSYDITSNYQIKRWADRPDASTPKYIKYSDGNIGIDKTTSPSSKLHVGDGISSTGSTAYRYFSQSGNNLGSTASTTSITNICSTFEGSLLVYGKVSAASDLRIKTGITDINDDSALQKIVSIQPKTYEYIDQVCRGSNIVHGFIAQQVNEVIPEAVRTQSDVIPDIYRYASAQGDKIILKSMDSIHLAMGDTLEIIDMNEQHGMYHVVSTDPSTNSMTLDKPLDTSNVFVYGSYVQDFHVLDKTYVYTLNVCATQTLSEKIKGLQSRIRGLI